MCLSDSCASAARLLHRDNSPDISREDAIGANSWVVALLSISFDLDVGQQVLRLHLLAPLPSPHLPLSCVPMQVDECFPPESLSPEEMMDVAFHSFPDSMSMELHSKSSIRDSLFFFRHHAPSSPSPARGALLSCPLPLRYCSSSPALVSAGTWHCPLSSPSLTHLLARNPCRVRRRGSVAQPLSNGGEAEGSPYLSNGNSPLPSCLSLSPGEGSDAPGGVCGAEVPPFLYGYVFCRQRQDSSLPRGGEQRSVVVVSEQPYTSVLRPLSQIAGPLFFSYGREALIQVCCRPAQGPPSFTVLPSYLTPLPRLPLLFRY